ncbi:hypothetical protein C2U72_01780 [Prosthecomicrobium hirschii]|uniref:ImmA/IrrE family metallo-endopeptidase n=1 Tax=Prosthecodimorpha hirschii TaxID=665126 RepID=UPI0015E47EA9|nr:ImmA/IrrE family metallo-endopeptidase [Prosthecomicrobium hirschii]TPQ52717.1 hypothetical protein C2U72_01780 [Prosthecomicrobium hirschii]
MPITADYPHHADTAEPVTMTAPQIWAVANRVRRQVHADLAERAIDVGAIVDGASGFSINGIAFDAFWDLDHAVANEAGDEVMGTTEYDPADPTSIMVSINGPVLAGRDDLLRSTAAHELGHVVFEAPAWIAKATGQVSVSYCAEGSTMGRLAELPVSRRTNLTAHEIREARANEFMGGFLVPPQLAKVDLLRIAKRSRMKPSPRPSAILQGPAFDAEAIDGSAGEDLLFELAERYRVSEAFIRVRLSRYDLLRTEFSHGR